MKEFDRCPCTGVNLDRFIQTMILLYLAEQDLHGYGLVQKIMESPMSKGEKPDPTGVYRILKSMEARGLVVSSWDLPESGPPKRIYRITTAGMACLDRWVTTLRDYVNSLEALIVNAEKILGTSNQGTLAQNQRIDPTRGAEAMK